MQNFTNFATGLVGSSPTKPGSDQNNNLFLRAVNSAKDLGWNDRLQAGDSPSGHFVSAANSRNQNSLHLESWKGLVKAGVHVKQ